MVRPGSKVSSGWCPLWRIALVCVTVCAGGMASGQATVGDVVPSKAIRITIGGEVSLSLVVRNEEFFQATLGAARSGVAPTALGLSGPGRGGAGTGSGGDVFIDPQISLDVSIQLREGVHGVLEIATPFNVFSDAGGANTASGANAERFLAVQQAYVLWEGAFNQPLDLKVGIQDFKKDWSGTGNPFFVDVSRSENPFGNPTLGTDVGTPQSPSSGLVGTQEAAGIYGDYAIGDASIDLFYFTIRETFRSNRDNNLYGATLSTDGGPDAPNPWNLGAGVFVLESDSRKQLYTFGLGGAVSVMDQALKLYGELYTQHGHYADAPGAAGDIRARNAFAAMAGMRYQLPEVAGSPFVDVSFWEVSGDDNGGDDKNGNFVSLENNNDTLVVENGYYGLDLDTNYRAIKIKGGFEPMENLHFEALYAYFELQDNGSGTYSNGTTRDKIGDEIDLTLRYFATDYLTFRLATGWLFSPVALGTSKDLNVSLFEVELKF